MAYRNLKSCAEFLSFRLVFRQQCHCRVEQVFCLGKHVLRAEIIREVNAIQNEVFQSVSVSLKLSLHGFATVVDAEMGVSVLRVNLGEVEVSLGQILFERAPTTPLPQLDLRGNGITFITERVCLFCFF